MTKLIQICSGTETDQVDDRGRRAVPHCWYWRDADTRGEGECLSAACGSPRDARENALAAHSGEPVTFLYTVKAAVQATRDTRAAKSKADIKNAAEKPITLGHRDHDVGGTGRVRVWQTDWSGDCFNVLSRADFEALQRFAEMFPRAIRLEMADD